MVSPHVSPDLSIPSYLDTRPIQGRLPDLSVKRRQHVVVGVFVFRVVDKLEILDHVSPRVVARWIGIPPNPFSLKQLA